MTETKKKPELVRIGMNFPKPLLDRVKEYADSLCVNTTTAFIFLVNQALQQKDMYQNFPLMVSMINELKQYEKQENSSNDK